MDIRPVTDDYAVAPQIDPAEVAELPAAGYRTLICNRPDDEVPPELQSAAMERAAREAGLRFVYNPVINGGLTIEAIDTQRDALEESPALAYCRSGTRSTIVWALGQAGRRSTDDIIAAAGRAGYELGGLRGQIDQLATR